MMARLVGIILGVILATSGYVIAGLGALGDWAQNLDLGPFEPHRPFVGWAAAITGALLLVAALTPRPKPKPRQSKATAVLDLAPAASPILGPDAAPAPEPALEPAPPKQIARTVEPVAPPMRLTSATPAVLPAGLDDPVAEPMRLSDPTPVPPPVEIPPPEASVEAIMPPPIAEPPPAEPVIIPAVAAPTPETPPEPPPAAAPAPAETFDDLRARLIAQSRAEAWPEAAQTLNRLLRVAGDNREKALARRDLGDFARGQGRLDDAAEAYDDAVSYAREARAAKPASEGDFAADDLLAGALSGVGDVAEMEGRLNDALSAFEEALALRRSHGGREAADPNARRALSVSLERLADLREDRGHRMRALDLYRESYDVAARLAAADPARFGADLASTRARLAELEAKVAG